LLHVGGQLIDLFVAFGPVHDILVGKAVFRIGLIGRKSAGRSFRT
jgi:hypothetical protein